MSCAQREIRVVEGERFRSPRRASATTSSTRAERKGAALKHALMIAVAVIVVFSVSVTCGCQRNASDRVSSGNVSATAGQSGSASSAPIDVSAFVGTWELESGTVEGLEPDRIELVHELGLSAALRLRADGSGSFSLFDDESDVSWQAASATAGTLAWDGAVVNLSVEGDGLVAERAGQTMTFARVQPTKSATPTTAC